MTKSFEKLVSILGERPVEDIEDYIKKDINNYIDIELDHGVACIENRARHCDRGRYIIKIFSKNIAEFYIDQSDMFPRYYFIFSNAITELCEFLDFRKLKIVKVSKKRLGLIRSHFWDFEERDYSHE